MRASTSTPVSVARQGFTLVEVLVSSFLTLIVMGMLFAVLMGTITAWESGTSRLRSSGNARLALDILKTDLESMVVRQTQYNQEWMVSGPLTVEGVDSTWMMFFAPSLDRDSGQDGDIVALSYRVVYQDPIAPSLPEADQRKIFGLYKAMVNTTNTFQDVLGQSDIITGYWGSNIPKTEESAGLLAPNVVQFDIAWHIRDGNNVFRYGPENTVRLTNQLDAENTSTGWSSGSSGINGKIEAADVTLTTISDEGMRRYTFLNDPSKLGAIIREFGRTHTLRVPINY